MELGFESWGKSDLKEGGSGGQVLDDEVKAWVQNYARIYQK
jgi:hypothetical protein